MKYNQIGKGVDRADGRLKVQGLARYSAEYTPEGCTYAVIVKSTIPAGRITGFDSKAAQAHPGVLAVITHKNMPKVKKVPLFSAGGAAAESWMPLQDDKVHYNGQHIAVVVGSSLQAAQGGAELLRVSYSKSASSSSFEKSKARAHKPAGPMLGKPADLQRGEGESGLAKSPQQVNVTYETPMETHNPMEPSATVAHWSGKTLTVWDASQGVFGCQNFLATALSLPKESVRVITKYVGGGFGCKGTPWPHVLLAAAAARVVKRPVKLVLTRPQMFTSVGHRAIVEQKISLGADAAGKLETVVHHAVNSTSTFSEFVEPCTLTTRMLYPSPNLQVTQRLVDLNLPTPTFMRAPGETPCTFALESAMDELAVATGVDPIELRLLNYAETNPEDGKPWSSKSLRECYRVGAESIGWKNRVARPGSVRQGRWQIGLGMATALYPAHQMPAGARLALKRQGDRVSAVVQCGTTDIGVGSWTVFRQITADLLGLPLESVSFELGDTELPFSSVAGGSSSVGSVGRAIFETAGDLILKLQALAGPEWAGLTREQLILEDGKLGNSDRTRWVPLSDLVARAPEGLVEAKRDKVDPPKNPPSSSYSFGAQFAEVKVDAELGIVRVSRFAGAFAAGRIVNRKTARSQYLGGITMGIGMALMEETVVDPRWGRLVTDDLAEYHVPTHADVPKISVHLVDEVDTEVNPLGTKGIGEIGITGVAAAIANAVFNATGKRIRSLPITLDKLI